MGGKRETRLYPIATHGNFRWQSTREVQPTEAGGSCCISLLALTRFSGSIGRLIVSRLVR